MKKLLYIGNNLSHGNPTTITQLSLALKTENFEVLVYSNKKNIFFRLLDMCWGIIKNYNASYILIDTYSTANFYYTFITSQIARLLHIKYIPILHGGNLPNRLNDSALLSKMIFKNSYINVSPSKYLYHEFSKSGYNTIYIPNAISMRLYPFTLRSVFTPKLLWVRAFDEIYNPKMAVEVLFELKKKYKNAALCMVGPNKDGSLQEVIDLAKTKNVADSIEYTGLLSKQEWIKKSKNYSFFINTTNFDNMPVSIIEAMALGLPVISTNVGGMPYLIEDGVTGKLVAKNNVLQMVNTIESIIENSSLGIEITKNAKQQVSHFDEAIVKKMWLNLLK